MIRLDENGLRLAEFQGKIFEKSLNYLNCSTKIFIRRFKHSNLLQRLDENDSSIFSLDPYEALNHIEEEFGKSNYGKEKLNNEAMFWVGYMYRYISYTRKVKTQFIMKAFPFDELYSMYYSYHTQDPEWVINTLLEKKNLDKNYFDPNWRIKTIMKNNLYNYEYNNDSLIKLIKDYLNEAITLNSASKKLGCNESEFKRIVKVNKSKISK